jgi:hypothetical protein
MFSDPFRSRKNERWNEERSKRSLDDLEFPAQPEWQRCSAVRCVESGPWSGTLVCCMRKSGHQNEHQMTLGDAGSPDYWLECWF